MRLPFRVSYLFLILTFMFGTIFAQDSLGAAARRMREQKIQDQTPPGGWPPPPMKNGLTSEWIGTPVSKITLLAWAAAGLAPADAARELQSRGVDFPVDETFIALLKAARAEKMLDSVQAATLHSTSAPEAGASRLENLAKASAAMKEKKFEAALKIVAEQLRSDPENSDLLFAAGNILLELENNMSAVMALTKSIEKNTKFPYAHGRLAYALYRVGDGANAQVQALFMLSLVSDSADAYKYLGLAYDAQGGYAMALEQYEKALAIDPANYAVYFDIGIARAGLKDWTAAIEAYQHADRLNDHDPHLLNNLGIALGRAGRVDEGVSALERAKALDGKDPQIRQSYGALLCNSGRYEGAVREFTELLRMDPEWNMARPCLAKALARLGRTEEAEKVKADYARYEAGER